MRSIEENNLQTFLRCSSDTIPGFHALPKTDGHVKLVLDVRSDVLHF